MLTKDEQDALEKVIEVYNTIAGRMPFGSPTGALAAAELTKAWAMFAKKVEENN